MTTILGGLIFVSIPVSAIAIQITEIMYDPAGTDDKHEWVEIYNESTSSVDIKGWKLFESGSNHTLTAVRGDLVLDPGEYTIIADDATAMIADYLNASVGVIDSAFSLSNSGETIEIRDASGATITSASYTNALGAGDGSSLHWISGSWQNRLANPGSSPDSAQSVASQTTETTTTTGTTTNTSSTQNANTSTTNTVNSSGGTSYKPAIIQPFYTLSVTLDPIQVVARTPALVQTRVIYTNDQKQQFEYTSGIIKIITGDGRELSQKGTNPVSITYSSAGMYHMIVEYWTSTIATKPDSVYQSDVVVVDPAIQLIRRDSVFFLHNTQSVPVDISGWILRAGELRLPIAKHTILSPNAEIALPSEMIQPFLAKEIISLVLPDAKTVVSTVSKQSKQNKETITQGPIIASEQKVSKNTNQGNRNIDFVLAQRNTISADVPVTTDKITFDVPPEYPLDSKTENPLEFSTGAKVGIGVGSLFAIIGIYFIANTLIDSLVSKKRSAMNIKNKNTNTLSSDDSASKYEIKDWE